MDNPFLAPPPGGGNVVLDLDGVVFLGADPIPGAGAALRRLESDGWNILVATNNATREPSTIVERIQRQTGFVVAEEAVVTSAIAAMSMLREGDRPVYVVGEAGLRATLRDGGNPLTEDAEVARSVVVALDRGFTYDRLAAASTAVREGARFIATNSDVTFPTPDGEVPGAGAIVAAVAAAAGVEPEFAGKPHPAMIEAVRSRLGPGETWMIGDRPETDLAFGRAAGWKTVLTLSGVTSDARLVPQQWAPDLVLRSIAEIAQ